MNIRQATNALSTPVVRRRMRRPGWPDTRYIRNHFGDLLWDDDDHDQAQFTTADILADDWIVVEMPTV